jgi:hypothetical protein
MSNTVSQQDYELLSQYLDGELPGKSDLEQRLAAEPELRAVLERMQAQDSRLHSAFNKADVEHVPASITRLLQPVPADVLARPRRATPAWGYALAASLAVAVCGTLLSQWGEQGSHGGTAGLDSALAAALENTPSSGSDWLALPDNRAVRPVLSFQSNNGQWCREYLLSNAGSHWHGVACRTSNDGWANGILAATGPSGSASEYRPAGAANPEQVSAYIELQAGGIPLSAEQEKQLIEQHWQQ